MSILGAAIGLVIGLSIGWLLGEYIFLIAARLLNRQIADSFERPTISTLSADQLDLFIRDIL